jgi:type III secretion protein J
MRKIFAASIVALTLGLAACDQQVYSGLSSKDANEMVALLYRNGINAVREQANDGTYAISVDSNAFAPTVEILNRYGYPREQYKSVADVFKGEGLIVSPFEQRARLNYATSQELTKTISEIDGVVSVRVHVVLPELDLRTGNNSKPSASVMIVHRPSVDTMELSSKVRLLVANAIQDLDYKSVSIAFFPSDGVISGSLAGAGETGMNNGSGDNGPGGGGSFNLAKLMSFSPSVSFMLWIGAALVAASSLIIFLRRLQSRA